MLLGAKINFPCVCMKHVQSLGALYRQDKLSEGVGRLEEEEKEVLWQENEERLTQFVQLIPIPVQGNWLAVNIEEGM